MLPEAKAKLLTFLNNKEIRPIGCNKLKNVDVKIIAATNSDIEGAITIRAREFRFDLYQRLNVVRIHIPPLRERKDEIPRLCTHILKELLGPNYSNKKRISKSEAEKLEEYDWPGNIRELQNCIEKAVRTKHGRELFAHDIVFGCK